MGPDAHDTLPLPLDWRTEQLHRRCNRDVARDSDGNDTFCVLDVGHPEPCDDGQG